MILFVSHEATRTGAPIVLLHLLKWIKKNTDLDFEILLKKGGELISEFESVNPTYLLQSNGMVRKICRKLNLGGKFSLSVPAAIAGKRYALIYSNTITNGKLVSLLMNKSKRVITHVHEMDSWMELIGKDNWIEVVGQTTGFIAVSEPVRDCLIRRGVHEDTIKLLPGCASMPSAPSAADRTSIRQALGISRDAFVIGGSGFGLWRKGRDLFVQLAATTIRKGKNHDFHFIWIGPHRDKAETLWLQHDSRLTGCENSVHWVGSVRNPEAYYSAMDAFAMISREDPMPLVAIEAGMMGVPVVCFAGAGGTADWVRDDAGYTVPYLDVTAMADKILLLADDRNLLQQKGSEARTITLARYSVDIVGKKFAEYLCHELKSRV